MDLFSKPDLELPNSIKKLRALTQINVQHNWRYCLQDLPVGVATEFEQWHNWPIAQLNEKEYIVWSAGGQVIWLGQQLIIPQDLQGYPLVGLSLRLLLTWWAESAQIFVNGQLVQEGDLFDSSVRILLSPAVVTGEKITVALRLVSPGHDIGGLMGSHCWYESTRSLDPGFVADELAVLQKYVAAFEPEKLDILAATVAEIDWELVSEQAAFTTSLTTCRQHLQSLILDQVLPAPKQRCIHLLGHAHLDLAWLWPVSETWEVAVRTFESVLNLQQDFPHLIFCHSTPAIYAWLEQHRPDLFANIQQKIAAGSWEVVGGMWVEPELNLIDGESIVRQILYAQRYAQEKFGKLTRVAWVPDSFGFPWQLPQFLQQGGIEYFVTQKLHWNDTNKFPHSAFWWQSPDGSQIFSLMSPPNLAGVMDTNPITMTSYAVDWETQTHLQDIFWLPGVGDHGGGPTRDMLEVAHRWQQSPFFPRMEFTTAEGYLGDVRETRGRRDAGTRGWGDKRDKEDKETREIFPIPNSQFPIPNSQFPIPNSQFPIPNSQFPNNKQQTTNNKQPTTNNNSIWNNELYLEFHRGCYTTHADQKFWNRRCEGLLYQAELFASLATITTSITYPQQQLEDAWKKVLFNQFHDILPGTSIPQVFVDANEAWQEVEQVTLGILEASLSAIASQITLPPPPQADAQPIIIFNPLNWQRSELVTVPLPQSGEESWLIYDFSGEKIPSQPTDESKLLFLAKEVPSVGYRVFWLCQGGGETRRRGDTGTRGQEDKEDKGGKEDKENISNSQFPIPNSQFPILKQPTTNNFILENHFLRVVVNPKTGDLSSVFDKIQQREVLRGAGNQLQAFQDKGQYWDAWNIDPNYEQHPLPPTQLQTIQWIERGVLCHRLRVVRQLRKSQFCQDYILAVASPLLKIATTVDWQESHVLVKAAFPLNLEGNHATYEIACGAIQRPTQPQTPLEQAKWEVSALRWADLGDETYGVSLLNDGKYGYDAQSSQLRLTLLRSPNWPDPQADRGIHHFTYALYPHSGSWQSAGVVRQGYELNLPLQLLSCPPLISSPVEYLHFSDNKAEGRRQRAEGKEEGNDKCLTGHDINSDSHRSLPSLGRLLDLSAENLVLTTFKRSQDDPNRWILRCYESHGNSADLSLESDLGLSIGHRVDLLETPIDMPETSQNGQIFQIAPWKIASFELGIGNC
ncbi:MAG: alpha-mannosidase [Symploca sp. SIO2E6]|nr:alpha-mannosidase [Symploca sp. SIO2E6]